MTYHAPAAPRCSPAPSSPFTHTCALRALCRTTASSFTTNFSHKLAAQSEGWLPTIFPGHPCPRMQPWDPETLAAGASSVPRQNTQDWVKGRHL